MEQNNETNTNAEQIVNDVEKEKLQFTPEQQKLFDDKIGEITRKAYERAEKKANDSRIHNNKYKVRIGRGEANVAPLF